MENFRIFHRVENFIGFLLLETSDFDAIQLVARCYLIVIRQLEIF